jgi:hypothetical protein
LSYYDWEYFCGANVVVELGGSIRQKPGMPALEAAGISYNFMDSSQPIYGYSSEYFDAVAPGQRIIQGSIVVNFVHANYMHHSINQGRAHGLPPDTASIADAMRADGVHNPPDDQSFNNLWRTYLSNSGSTTSTAEAGQLASMSGLFEGMRNKYWGEGASSTTPSWGGSNVFDMGPASININFGNKHQIRLSHVVFIGRSSTIQIDESVLLEEYPFFARKLVTLGS